VSLLLSIEAGDVVICHSVLLFSSCWHCLNEADHSLVTLRVKFAVISSFHIGKLSGTILLGVVRDGSLDVVLKVGEESQTILKFYSE